MFVTKKNKGILFTLVAAIFVVRTCVLLFTRSREKGMIRTTFMLSVIRKNQHSLTLLIVILTIISFIWLYNRTNLSQVGTNDVASVYGRVIQQAEVESEAREDKLAVALGLTDFVRDLGGLAENEDVALNNFIVNSLVIEHQSSLLNIKPTDEAVSTAIQALPAFQVQGAFDSKKYASFLKEQLIPRGFTERHLEEVILNSLRFKKLRELVTSPIFISEAQVREAARIYQAVTAQVVRFNRSIYLANSKNSSISLEEEKSFYEKNKNAFVSEETRAVSYVIFELPAAQQKLEGKERVHAMQQLSDKMTALKQKCDDAVVQGKSFEKVAAESGFNVVTTTDFNHEGKKAEAISTTSSSKKQTAIKSASDKLPPQAVLPTAFKLAKVADVSEVIQMGQTFYIISLSRMVPSRPLAFAEVQSKIEALLREGKADKLMQEDAKKTYQAVHQAMLSGKNFADALKSSGKTAELLTGIIPTEMTKSKNSLEQQAAIGATLVLKEGDLSELKHDRDGAFMVYLQHRAPLSDADWKTHHPEIEEAFLEQQRNLLFFDWLRQARVDANVTMLNARHRAKTR